jgi:hypothetical protein
MKNLKVTTRILAILFVTLTAMSCKSEKKEEHHEMEMTNEMEHNNENTGAAMGEAKVSTEKVMYNVQGSDKTLEIVKTYLHIKDALVADNSDAAKEAGKMATRALKNFDLRSFNVEQQEQLKGFIASATTNAEGISDSTLNDQRKYFKQFSMNINEIIAIAGTEHKLYQQFCPMYDWGSAWLSAEKDIKNPFYGSKMLTCGTVKKEIN